MTIKKRIAASFAFMLAVPVLLMMLTGLFFRLYYFGSALPWEMARRAFPGPTSAHGPMSIAPVILIAGASVFLLLGNAILSFTVSRSILVPLAALEAAALRIKDGDLSPIEEVDRGTGDRAGIDEFARVAASFEEMRSRLHRSLVERSEEEENRRELVACISHDLRTPIAAILGYVEGLSDGVADTSEKRERYLAIIRSKAQLMSRLVDDLSLFSGLETAGVKLETVPIGLGSFLGELISELAFDHPGLSILQEDLAPLVVDIDRAQFRRVIANIVQNAALHAAPCTLRVSLARKEDAAVIVFADDGPGICATDLPHIFTGFFRGDRSRTLGRGGHGLGLSIARMIVEAHGGRIHAESPTGGGTRIVIHLPCTAEAAGAGSLQAGEARRG